jgi:hypothetical protein
VSKRRDHAPKECRFIPLMEDRTSLRIPDVSSILPTWVARGAFELCHQEDVPAQLMAR